MDKPKLNSTPKSIVISIIASLLFILFIISAPLLIYINLLMITAQSLGILVLIINFVLTVIAALIHKRFYYTMLINTNQKNVNFNKELALKLKKKFPLLNIFVVAVIINIATRIIMMII